MSRKAFAAPALGSLLIDLAGMETEFRNRADEYLRMSKAYACRSTSEVRAGLVKSASVLRLNADQVAKLRMRYEDQINGKTSKASSAPAVVGRCEEAVGKVELGPEAQDGPLAGGEESSDQDA